jgi:hypothetical protein
MNTTERARKAILIKQAHNLIDRIEAEWRRNFDSLKQRKKKKAA